MTVAEKTLRKLIKESIRDVLKEERFSLYEILIPLVSKNEMRDIEKRYSASPSSYRESDFKDLTGWVMK